MPEKISVSSGVIKSFIRIIASFADRQRNGTVRKKRFDVIHNVAKYFVCEIAVFAALKNKSAKAQRICGFTAVKDLFF